jgi:DNA-binding response OmpR family regulator
MWCSSTSLPDIDGFAVTQQVDAGSAGPVVVLTSTREAADYGGRIVRCGAAGFISKPELSAQWLARVVARRWIPKRGSCAPPPRPRVSDLALGRRRPKAVGGVGRGTSYP